jgi:hypothetical protein
VELPLTATRSAKTGSGIPYCRPTYYHQTANACKNLPQLYIPNSRNVGKNTDCSGKRGCCHVQSQTFSCHKWQLDIDQTMDTLTAANSRRPTARV